ncbi:MAG TPA: cytochrome c family protein [Fimbriimonadaceae bacterium]|nr:cytochrome c family protein [Fimbriimonadaceae bacterium]
MKALLWLAACAIFGFGAFGGVAKTGRQVLLIVGGTDGYVSPCGCVEPMTGGIRRRITALRLLSVKDRTTIVDNGDLVGGNGRQDEMKAEALAECMGLVHVDALNYGVEEARLGAGMADSLDRLSGGALLSTGLSDARLPTKRFRESGPFVIGAVDGRSQQLGRLLETHVEDVDSSVRSLLDEARDSGKVPVLLMRGDFDQARSMADRHPGLRLIVCDVKTTPPAAPIKVGRTLIVTPGERGKFVVKIEWDGTAFAGYSSTDLGPEFKDDAEAQKVYSAYLGRVAREGLLAMLPREPTKEFAGSAACTRCHKEAAKVWEQSAHANALSTLEREGHEKDPDCVSCHVVGLSSVHGFVSRETTPMLADVGCESCHGPARAHAMRPNKNKMAKVESDVCTKCHNTEHSPGFDFKTFWPKIAH